MPESPATEAWLISGIPGSGKSTVARLLCERLSRAAHIEGDRLQEWIVSGSVPPGQQPRAEEERQIRLCIRNQCLLARSFAGEGFVPVLDYVVVSRDRLAYYREYLGELRIHLVVLAPGREAALRRDLQRSEKTVAAQWSHLETEIKRELSGLGLWVDNGAQSPEQTVDFIVHRMNVARVR